MPPQLRWFMRTTFMPAARPFAAMPSMYWDSLEPSRPCTMITVRALSRSVCQWQWHKHLNAGFNLD